MSSLISKCSIEFVAIAMFHFIGSVYPTPFTNGLALMILVYYAAHVSNAHLNPAISLTFCLLGYTDPLEMICYWIAQFSGCAVGALFLAMLVPDLRVRGIQGSQDGCFYPREDLNHAQIFGWEAVCTFNFFISVFTVVWYTLHKKGYGSTGPIVIGLSLMANAYVAGSYTGAALNPARVLGSTIVFDCGNQNVLLYYVLGEMLAGCLVPLAIIPWYGISANAWYLKYLPKKMTERMIIYQPSLRLSAENPLPISSPFSFSRPV